MAAMTRRSRNQPAVAGTTRGGVRGQPRLEVVDPVAGAARDHEDGVKAAPSRQSLGEPEQALAPYQIDLVQREDRCPVARNEAVEDAARIAVDPPCGIDQQHRFVGILRP